jgi:sugar/nucleoside kinase (ribokinase family)
VTWPVAVAGTVHRDDITTPYGRATTLGGSAVYFALAASRHAPVHLNGIVGRADAEALLKLLAGAQVDLDGLVTSDRPTFVWHAEHDFERWVTASESSEPGCDPEWEPRLSERSAAAPLLFLASMAPRLQRGIALRSRATVVAMDTMTVFTEAERSTVREVAELCDLAFLNSVELASLTGVDEPERAAQTLIRGGRTRAVVVKRGPLGASVVGRGSRVEGAAHPVRAVVDPTGAGDSLAGGFLGYCAAAERCDESVFGPALDAGLACAALAISSFGTEALRRAAPRPSVSDRTRPR